MNQAQYALGPAANGYIQNENGNWYEPTTGSYWWDQDAQTQQEQRVKQYYDQYAASTPGVIQLPDDLAKQYIAQLNATGGVLPNSPLGQILKQYGLDVTRGTNYDPNDPLGRVFTTNAPPPKHHDSTADVFQEFDKHGLAVFAAPLAVAGGAAFMGASAAGGAGGAGAVGAAGASEGAGAYGLGEAFGGMAAPEAVAAGAAPASAASGASLIGGAGSDTLGASGAEEFGFDPGGEGMFNTPTTADTTIFPNGMDPSYLQQALDLAKQYGITPQSALKSILSAGGRALPGILGAVGANQQANSLNALADKYMALGAPSRARYEASFAPGFSMANEPGYKDALDQTTKATLHGLSVTGNPAQSPNAWNQTLTDINSKFAFPALQNFRNMNSNAGGISSLQTAAPAAATGAINAQGNIFNAIGAGVNDIFNPQPTLAETLAQYKKLLGTTA